MAGKAGFVDGAVGKRTTVGPAAVRVLTVGLGSEAIQGDAMARYTMRQRLVSIGEDFDIADELVIPALLTAREHTGLDLARASRVSRAA